MLTTEDSRGGRQEQVENALHFASTLLITVNRNTDGEITTIQNYSNSKNTRNNYNNTSNRW